MINDLHFAVVVGINCYPGIKRQLTTAREDAEAFAAWLKNPNKGGLPEENVSLIKASSREESGFSSYLYARPVIREVFQSLQHFHDAVKGLSDERWERTRLYIYAAGHGLAPAEGRGAIIFADTNPSVGYWTEYLDLYQYNLLYERFTPFSEILLFSDCCRELNNEMPPTSPVPFRKKLIRGPTRRVQGYATEYSHMAGADASAASASEPEARGFFTRALLEGLEGEARYDRETGIVDSTQLGKYITQQVPVLAAAKGYEQRADFTPSLEPIALARVELRKYDVTVSLPDDWRGDVALVAGYPGVVIDKRTVAAKQATFSVPKGIYRFIGGDIPPSSPDPSSAILESKPFLIDGRGQPDVVTLDRKI